MTGAVTLRSAGPADEPFLAEVYASTRRQELAGTGWSEASLAGFLDQQFQAQQAYWRAQFGSADFSVVEMGSRPVGRFYVDRSDGPIRIIDIALLPEHRNSGIGSRLLGDVLREAAATSRPVRMHVEKANRALKLYRSLGFSIVADSGVYWSLECRPEPSQEGAQ